MHDIPFSIAEYGLEGVLSSVFLKEQFSVYTFREPSRISLLRKSGPEEAQDHDIMCFDAVGPLSL